MKNVISILISLLFLLFSVTTNQESDPQIVFLDVFQGDSMLFLNGDFQMIVDGGGGDYLINRINEYVSIWDRNIELVVITHPHADHYLGIIDLLERFDIENLIVSNSNCVNDKKYEEIMVKAKDKGTNIVESIDINVEGVEIGVVQSGEYCTKRTNLNNLSLVTTIIYNNFSILNVGDLENDRGDKMAFPDIDILKAGHHCSNTSSSEEFLEKTSPKAAICSVGLENKYGHPSKETLDVFDNLGIKYFHTYSTGDIVVNLKTKVIYNEENNVILRL